jgi:transcriptional regulator with XRE-family HTH domain
MIDFTTLPLTPDNARAARNFLGMSQAKAADESGLPSHKIKRFEAGNYIPDEPFMLDLRGFYEARGYEFQDTPKPGEKAKAAGQVIPAGAFGAPAENQGKTGWRHLGKTTFHHMRIAVSDEDQMGRIMDLIEENEQAAQGLLQRPIETAFFGGLSEQCQARHGEALALLAENGRLFARLFGRSIGGEPRPDLLEGQERPKTHADLLHKQQADAHLFAIDGSRDAHLRKQAKAKKPASNLLEAVFG